MKRKRYKTARCILYCDERYLLADHKGRPLSSRKGGEQKTRWGLPGGHIEWREEPIEAARREVLEELNVYLGDLWPVGDYLYKQRLHAVYAAPSDTESFDLDFSELHAVRWFSADEVEVLRDDDQLHAGYEFDAIMALEEQLSG